MRPNPGVRDCYAAWVEELSGDPDETFLLHGIRNGFDIVDATATPVPVEVNNNSSARPGSTLYDQATKQVLSEIECGNYIVCEDKPAIVSPLSAIAKPDGGIRLIHDGSQPEGTSMNDYATLDTHHRFQTVDDAAKHMYPGYYMAKVDLKAAYRSVPISQHSQNFTGLKWTFDTTTIYLRDSKLPFGSRLAPGIFHRLTQSVRRMMTRKFPDVSTIVYPDDFLIMSSCQEALAGLIALHVLRRLGLQISWHIKGHRCLPMSSILRDPIG